MDCNVDHCKVWCHLYVLYLVPIANKVFLCKTVKYPDKMSNLNWDYVNFSENYEITPTKWAKHVTLHLTKCSSQKSETWCISVAHKTHFSFPFILHSPALSFLVKHFKVSLNAREDLPVVGDFSEVYGVRSISQIYAEYSNKSLKTKTLIKWSGEGNYALHTSLV